jgi:hypothetical protein
MSLRKAATAKTAGGRRAAQAPVKPAAKPAPKPTAKTETANGASADAQELAAQIERGLKNGRLDTLTPQAFQVLMAALCKSYSAQLEAGGDFLPLADRNSVSPTEIMTTTSALLKSANLAVFELGMWQSWTGR